MGPPHPTEPPPGAAGRQSAGPRSLLADAAPGGTVLDWAAARSRTVLLWLSRRRLLQRLTAEFAPARRMARRFVAGEHRTDAIAAARALADRGVQSTVAYLGEHSTDAEQARAAVREYVHLVHGLAAAGLEANCSLKLTQLGLAFAPELAEEGLRTVLAAAGEVGGFVRIDMEGTEVLPATLDLFERVTAAQHGPWRTGVVIQAYLRRSEQDVRRLVERGAPVRLVKGAYAEPAALAFVEKAEVDASFVRLAALLLSPEARATGVYPAFATHDPAMIAAVERLAQERSIPADGYELQMLLGVRRDLQAATVQRGRRLRLYLPYGEDWYPYVMRRLAERPANLWFLLRNVLRP